MARLDRHKAAYIEQFGEIESSGGLPKIRQYLDETSGDLSHADTRAIVSNRPHDPQIRSSPRDSLRGQSYGPTGV